MDVVKDTPVPTSLYFPPEHLKTDVWSSSNYSILERVSAKVIELRVRLNEYFQDFDNLRKGFCTVGQLDTVFGRGVCAAPWGRSLCGAAPWGRCLCGVEQY